MALDVAIVRTGTANIASVIAGLERAGARPREVASPDLIETAPFVVLPGVGSFGAAMRTLRDADLIEPLRRRIEADGPTLAVCVGLQLLCRYSEETPNATGLGVIDATIRRFPETVRVPQMGWNRVEPEDGCRFVEPGCAYFANSYRLDDRPRGWSVITAAYGGPFIAAVERGNVLACQFHPELSGPWGIGVIRRWLERVGAVRC